MKPVLVHREARAELDDAMAWYNSKEGGLGLDLEEETERAVARIQADPGVGANYRNTEYRFYRLKRFPYLIYYLDLHDAVWIAAIAHNRRRPGYWRKRKRE